MRSSLPALAIAVACVAAVALATATATELGAGSTVRSPNTGHEYVLEAEVEYSPRLQAQRWNDARAADAAVDADADADGQTALLQQNERRRHRRAGGAQRALGADDWTTGKQIGKGGFGAIFRGRRKGGGAKAPAVAIKQTVIANDAAAPAVREELAVQQTLAKLCPGLVMEALDSWETAPAVAGGKRDFFIVMPLMKSDLWAFAAKRASAKLAGDVPSALPVWASMISGVQCLHRNGYVHRDLKGGNWLIAADGKTVKLADFGETRTKGQIATTGSRLMPHQTIIYSAPTAVRIVRNAQMPAGVPVPKAGRAWDDYQSWDGYATGLTMLEVYAAKAVDGLALASTDPKLAHRDTLGMLEVFLSAFQTPDSYARFMAGLNGALALTPLPAEADAMLRGLLVADPARAVATIDVAGAPFSRAWIRSANGWVGSQSAALTGGNKPANANSKKSALKSDAKSEAKSKAKSTAKRSAANSNSKSKRKSSTRNSTAKKSAPKSTAKKSTAK